MSHLICYTILYMVLHHRLHRMVTHIYIYMSFNLLTFEKTHCHLISHLICYTILCSQHPFASELVEILKSQIAPYFLLCTITELTFEKFDWQSRDEKVQLRELLEYFSKVWLYMYIYIYVFVYIYVCICL